MEFFKKHRWLTRAMAAVAVLALALGVAWFWSNRPVQVQVQVAAVETNVPVRMFGLGTVEARILSKVGFEVGATLVELAADHGDRVRKGQVIAKLNRGEQEAKVAKARAALEIAGVNIRRAEANIEKTRAVLAQTEEANRRKQSLAGRDIVSQQQAAIIAVTHDEKIFDRFDHIFSLRDGRLEPEREAA